MLHQTGLPKFLWAEATHFAVWLKNRTPTKVLGLVTLYQKLYGTKPDFANLPEWGQTIWVHDPHGTKLDTRTRQARWIGYDTDSTHAHRIYWPTGTKISVEHNIQFVAPITAPVAPPVPIPTASPAPQPSQPKRKPKSTDSPVHQAHDTQRHSARRQQPSEMK